MCLIVTIILFPDGYSTILSVKLPELKASFSAEFLLSNCYESGSHMDILPMIRPHFWQISCFQQHVLYQI